MRFDFVGSLPEAMLNSVPADNVVINEYRKRPGLGIRTMPDALRKAITKARKPKKGAKRKGKAGPFEPAATPKKKVKKAARNPRSLTPVQEAFDSRTHSDLQG